jgi:hypothetical protein
MPAGPTETELHADGITKSTSALACVGNRSSRSAANPRRATLNDKRSQRVHTAMPPHSVTSRAAPLALRELKPNSEEPAALQQPAELPSAGG